uniref:Uncharacterized protein n=1 Tax=Rhipicephalus zambeziensis TaxID=60191 RepID=A0A224Y5K5_9ACAR
MNASIPSGKVLDTKHFILERKCILHCISLLLKRLAIRKVYKTRTIGVYYGRRAFHYIWTTLGVAVSWHSFPISFHFHCGGIACASVLLMPNTHHW